LHPDPERYQQIQQALADKGYYKGPVNGEWGDDSVSALKNFQADRKIDDDGKINAPSLIGLGLGPKHDGSSGRVESPPPAGIDPLASVPAPAEPQSSSSSPPE
jgi:peptidoglycan hydrolase-like protein with peptidoglycan-binding domain